MGYRLSIQWSPNDQHSQFCRKSEEFFAINSWISPECRATREPDKKLLQIIIFFARFTLACEQQWHSIFLLSGIERSRFNFRYNSPNHPFIFPPIRSQLSCIGIDAALLPEQSRLRRWWILQSNNNIVTIIDAAKKLLLVQEEVLLFSTSFVTLIRPAWSF